MVSPRLTCSPHSGLYSSATFSFWESGTCSQVACKAVCSGLGWLLDASWTNLPSLVRSSHTGHLSVPGTLPLPKPCLEHKALLSLSHPLLILLGWTRVLSWWMSSWTVYPTPFWVKCHYCMFSRYHIRLLRGVHQTWNIPFVRGSTRTETTHPGWAPS